MAFLRKLLGHTDLLVGMGLLIVVSMLILPLPHAVLDLGLCLAIASAVVILLSAINVEEPVKFSIFPSLLLVTTLFRLALSIAATKLILGSGEAGSVITTFGNFVMGGDFVVGFVAFLILLIVQFMVITNGAGRVSEVVARFTLDAMPGKQMAIDADLAAGLIDEEGARKRRKDVKQEADFYGAMDGASKFVKGDAIASLLIIAINIIGGIGVGMVRGEGDIMQIMQKYALLSVGEGLVSQLPALLISTASGLLVTRAGQERSMGGEFFLQVATQQKAILSAGAALACFAFIPGFPTLIFLGVGGAMMFAGRFLGKNPGAINTILGPTQNDKNAAAAAAGANANASPEASGPAPHSPEAVMPLLSVDPLEIEIGYSLTKLADTKAGGDLVERITATRRQLALDLGYVMPSVRIRDSISLPPNGYCVKVRGEEVARGVAEPDMFLAINSGGIVQPVPGIPTLEPVFNLEALWIDPANRDAADRNGYTVIEPSAMISTHLSEIVRTHAAELLTRQDVQKLVDQAKAQNTAVVEELIPQVIQLGDVQKVLQHLLRERVPIRDMVTILETMADYGQRVKDPEQLGELVRSSIARTITRQFLDDEQKLHCLTFDPSLERKLSDAIQHTQGGAILALDPVTQQQLIKDIREQSENAIALGSQPVLLCSANLRLPLRRLVERYLPQLNVLAYNEVSARAEVEFVGQIAAA